MARERTDPRLRYNSMRTNMANWFKTGALMLVLSVGLMFFAAAVGLRGPGLGVMLGIVVAMNVVSFWFSDKIALAMYRAKEVTPQQAPDLHAIVDELAGRAGIPKPRVYVIPTDALNAFATGRSPSHAAVAVTDGLYRSMNRDELTGVLAHEFAHVIHRDTLTGMIVASVAGAISMLASMVRWGALFGGLGGRDGERGNPIVMLVVAIVAPIAALVVQSMISRSREYAADATGAQLAGSPSGLINALNKLEQGAHSRPMQAATATAHMFIINPLSAGGLTALFRTHPATADRIARLQALAR